MCCAAAEAGQRNNRTGNRDDGGRVGTARKDLTTICAWQGLKAAWRNLHPLQRLGLTCREPAYLNLVPAETMMAEYYIPNVL